MCDAGQRFLQPKNSKQRLWISILLYYDIRNYANA